MTIDLCRAETESDGTVVYRPPLQAVALQLCCGAAWLVMKYPRETVNWMALAATGFAIVQLAGKPPRNPKRRDARRRQ